MILFRIKLSIHNSFIKHIYLFKSQVLKYIQVKMPGDIIFKTFFKNLNHTIRESRIGSFLYAEKGFKERKCRSVYIDQCSSKRFRLPASDTFLFDMHIELYHLKSLKEQKNLLKPFDVVVDIFQLILHYLNKYQQYQYKYFQVLLHDQELYNVLHQKRVYHKMQINPYCFKSN